MYLRWIFRKIHHCSRIKIWRVSMLFQCQVGLSQGFNRYDHSVRGIELPTKEYDICKERAQKKNNKTCLIPIIDHPCDVYMPTFDYPENQVPIVPTCSQIYQAPMNGMAGSHTLMAFHGLLVFGRVFFGDLFGRHKSRISMSRAFSSCNWMMNPFT